MKSLSLFSLFLFLFATSFGCCVNRSMCGGGGGGLAGVAGGCGSACGGSGCGAVSAPEYSPGGCDSCAGQGIERSIAPLAGSHFTCGAGSGCGGIYWSEWMHDPPDCSDPCDDCGNWVGPQIGSPRQWIRNGLAGIRSLGLAGLSGMRCNACGSGGCGGGCGGGYDAGCAGGGGCASGDCGAGAGGGGCGGAHGALPMGCNSCAASLSPNAIAQQPPIHQPMPVTPTPTTPLPSMSPIRGPSLPMNPLPALPSILGKRKLKPNMIPPAPINLASRAQAQPACAGCQSCQQNVTQAHHATKQWPVANAVRCSHDRSPHRVVSQRYR